MLQSDLASLVGEPTTPAEIERRKKIYRVRYSPQLESRTQQS